MTRIFLLLTALAITVGLFYFRSQQHEQLQRLQAAESAAQDASARAADADVRSDKFKRELLKIQAEELLRPRPTSSTNATPKTEHPATRLFRDPEMRAAMEKEHEKSAERYARRFVSTNLIAQLQLTDEQAAALRELVRKKHAPGMQMTIALMDPELPNADLARTGRDMRDQRNAADAEIRAFLGEDRYALYAWQENSEPERSRINDFRAKLTEAGASLTPEQEDTLLRAMYDERLATPFTHDFHNPHNFDMDRLPEIFAEPSLDQFILELEQLNDRIIQRAQSILPPDQSGEFAQSLRDHFERSKMTVKMTAALFPVRRKN